jgi:lysozyme
MIREPLIRQLTAHEGLRLKPYKCTAGKTSIGIGRNLDDRGITEAEALYLLNNDLDGVEADLDRVLPEWRSFSTRRQMALADMCFNLGVSKLLGFERMIDALKARDFQEASRQMILSRWADQVGLRARTLAKMMRDG